MTCPHLDTAETWLKTSNLAGKLPQSIAVAWSGGIDSTALLLALHQGGFKVYAWHVDHAWHDASSADAEHLARQAKRWGIPFVSVRLGIAPNSNREAHARQGRYRAFQTLSEQYDIHAVAVGHHADDQAETVCMRMLQGAGVMGCRGMGEQSQRDALMIFRPLLHVRRSALQAALQGAQVDCLQDASNKDVSLWRNRIRLQLFPAMQQAASDPYEIFMRWQKQAVLLSSQVNKVADQVLLQSHASGCSVLWHDWRYLGRSCRAQVLQRMAAAVLGKGAVFGRRHIELIEFWQEKGGRGGLDLSSCRLTHRRERLHLGRAKATSRADILG